MKSQLESNHLSKLYIDQKDKNLFVNVMLNTSTSQRVNAKKFKKKDIKIIKLGEIQ